MAVDDDRVVAIERSSMRAALVAMRACRADVAGREASHMRRKNWGDLRSALRLQPLAPSR
jgi:hypothetical protein